MFSARANEDQRVNVCTWQDEKKAFVHAICVVVYQTKHTEPCAVETQYPGAICHANCVFIAL